MVLPVSVLSTPKASFANVKILETSSLSITLLANSWKVALSCVVWASAAAYSSTEHKNEGYEFYTAFGEAYAYDFMSDMEALD